MSDDTDIADEDMPRSDDLFAAELVLGLLEGKELSSARARLVTDAAFSAQVMGWQERMVALTDDIDPVIPPKRIRKKLLKRLFAAPRVPLMERLWVWKGLTLIAISLAAYLGIQHLGPEEPDAGGPLYATQLSGDAVPLQVLAVVDPVRGDIALSRLEGAEAAGRVFELWAIIPDAAPISLGVLPEGSKMRVTLPDALRSRVAEITLAISDEPTGGSPTGAPTGDVLAAASVTEL